MFGIYQRGTAAEIHQHQTWIIFPQSDLWQGFDAAKKMFTSKGTLFPAHRAGPKKTVKEHAWCFLDCALCNIF